jgi:hypothetical protein
MFHARALAVILAPLWLATCDGAPPPADGVEAQARAQDSDDYPVPSPERRACYDGCLAAEKFCNDHPEHYPGVDCYEKYLDCVVMCDETTEIKRPGRIVVRPPLPPILTTGR